MSIIYERIVALQLQYSVTGNRLSCTMHYGADSTLDLDDPEALVNAWETAVLATWQAAVTQSVQFEKIYAYAIKPNTAKAGVDQLSGVAGDVEDEPLPENVALVLKKRQYEASSRHNGRLFIGGIGEADCVDGLFAPTPVAGVFKDLADALAAPVTISGGKVFTPVCLYRYVDGGIPTAVGYAVVGIDVTRSPGTQRRRMTELRSFVE